VSSPRPSDDTRAPAVLALVVVAVAVVIGVLVLSHSPPHKASSAGAARPSSLSTTTTSVAPTTPTTLVPPASIKLQVLNGVGYDALAGDWSRKLHASPGYDTLAPDNATSRVTASAIYVITPGYYPEAVALAQTVGLTSAAVNPTVPAPASAPIPPSERAEANLVLVIGPDLVAGATSAATTPTT
jgi:hypothetical protein